MSPPLYPALPIVVIDDEQSILGSLRGLLRHGGFTNVLTCGDSREAMPLLAERGAEAVLLDLSMPHVSGSEMLPQITENYPEIPVVVVTGQGATESVVHCMKAGAYDYLVKPVDKGRLLATVRQAVAFRSIHRENRLLRDRVLTSGVRRR